MYAPSWDDVGSQARPLGPHTVRRGVITKMLRLIERKAFEFGDQCEQRSVMLRRVVISTGVKSIEGRCIADYRLKDRPQIVCTVRGIADRDNRGSRVPDGLESFKERPVGIQCVRLRLDLCGPKLADRIAVRCRAQ